MTILALMHRGRRGLQAFTLAILPFVAQAAAAPVDRWREALLHHQPETVLVVAHRADWRDFPENSLPGIESCIAQGLAMVEIDLQRTRDGHLILMHDVTVDRTTTGQGKVAELTLAEIRALRLRDGLGSPTKFLVPTLREALLLSRGRILLNLDKGFRYFDEMLRLLEETGTTGQVLLKGPAPVQEMLATRRELLAKIAYMPVVNLGKPGAATMLADWLREAKPCAVEFVYAEWTPDVEAGFALCRKAGVRVWVNTLWPHLAGGVSDDDALADPEAVYGLLRSRGVSIFQTDRPRLLQEYLARRDDPVRR